jgi:hypothetical protein
MYIFTHTHIHIYIYVCIYVQGHAIHHLGLWTEGPSPRPTRHKATKIDPATRSHADAPRAGNRIEAAWVSHSPNPPVIRVDKRLAVQLASRPRSPPNHGRLQPSASPLFRPVAPPHRHRSDLPRLRVATSLTHVAMALIYLASMSP